MGQGQGQPAKVSGCRLPPSEVDLVVGGMRSGWSPRSIAARFNGITRKDVAGHMQNCVVNEEED